MLDPELTIKKLACNCESVLNPTLLEAYETLYQDSPELLFRETFDLPPELIQTFVEKHSQLYESQAEEVVQAMPEICIIRSGMFGGKTTLAFEIEDALKRKGLTVQNTIAYPMGEDYVTARSYTKGDKRRPALRFGGESYKEQIKELMNCSADFIFLDEFSFLIPITPVISLVEECRKHGKGLLLTGLDTNFLGDELPIFSSESPIYMDQTIKQIRCKSFVPGVCEVEPQGTSTIRYARVMIDGQYVWIYDMGVFPQVVSKEVGNVHYLPAMKGHTAKEILKDKPELSSAILHPTYEETMIRQQFLDSIVV